MTEVNEEAEEMLEQVSLNQRRFWMTVRAAAFPTLCPAERVPPRHPTPFTDQRPHSPGARAGASGTTATWLDASHAHLWRSTCPLTCLLGPIAQHGGAILATGASVTMLDTKIADCHAKAPCGLPEHERCTGALKLGGRRATPGRRARAARPLGVIIFGTEEPNL